MKNVTELTLKSQKLFQVEKNFLKKSYQKYLNLIKMLQLLLKLKLITMNQNLKKI